MNYFDVEKGEGAEGKWIQLSSSILKDEVNEFIKSKGWSNGGTPGLELLTKEFLTRPKDCKLVLFSMGTLVSGNRKVMNKLIPALAECKKHKFIVSKGKDGDQWELPANCVGANSLNQLELLKSGHLDAFISHMGNNSFTGSSWELIILLIENLFAYYHLLYEILTDSYEIQSKLLSLTQRPVTLAFH